MSPKAVIATIGVLAALASAGWWFSRPKPVAVTVQAVAKGPVESTVANTRAGSVEACRRARLSLAVGGQIQSLPIEEGDHVEAGQVLLALWNEDLKAQLLLAEQQRNAAVALAEQACARADVARADARRQEQLQRQNLVSEGDLEKAQGEAKANQAACGAAHSSIGVSDAQVKVAAAALERTVLRAPFAGTVAEINGELFEFVTPSPIGIPTPPAVDLIDDSCIYFKAPIDEVDAPAVRAGQTARVSLDAFPDRVFQARIRRVAPYVMDRERQSRTVDAEAELTGDAARPTILPGYSADIEILLDTVDDALRVPTGAVLDGPRVLVFVPDEGRIVARDIHTGLHNWRWTQVTDGLREAEQVVTSVDRDGVEDGAAAIVEPED